MRRGISFGTIAMILIACITLASTFGLILTIRKDEGDLAMDAEKLLSSVSELVAISQRHVNENDQQLEVAVTITAAPVVNTSVNAAQSTNNALASNENVPTPGPSSTAAPVEKHTVTMTFGGVVALESAVLEGAYRKADAKYAYDQILAGISPAVHADLNFAVLETLFSSGKSAQKDLLAPPEGIQALTSAGFDTVVLCTQNSLAGGETSVRETLQTLAADGLMPAGLYVPESYRPFEMLQINGMQIALLSYTETLSASSVKAVSDQSLQSKMIREFDLSAACEDVASARNQGADAVLVFLHWGTEEAVEPSASQRATAQALCNAGADLLLGYNCRNVHPVELLTSEEDPAHNMLSAWSLGTLISEDRDTRAVVSGALLHVQMTCDRTSGNISFDSVEYSPTYCWRQEENGVYPYRVVLSNQSVPEGMIQKQREIIARALVLIQTTMNKGIALQR